MIRRCFITLLLLTIAAFCISAPAAAVNDEYSYLGLDDAKDAVPQSVEDIMDDVELDETIDAGGTLKKIAEKATSSMGGMIRSAAGGALFVLAAAMLCSVAASVCPQGSKTPEYITLAGVLAITVGAASGVHLLVKEASEAINEMCAFSKLLLPALASASAVTGAAASSAAKFAAAALFLDILMTVGQKLIQPMIYMYVAVSAASAAFGGRLSGIAKLISRTVKLALTALSISFTAYLMITGLIASSADAAAVKMTKTAIATLLPVVGSMVSDAADAVASGVSVLRSAAGVFGMLVIIAVCALPFLRLAVSSFMFRAAAALSETVADNKLSGLIDSISTAYGMAMGLAGTTAIMLLISVISVTRAVTGT